MKPLVELACHVPGHEHVPGCQSDFGYELPFCEPHAQALPKRLLAPLVALAGASIYELTQHAAAAEALRRAGHWLVDRTSVPGICSECGCTEEFGCSGGCSWSGQGRTLCSRCAPAKTPQRKTTRRTPR